MDNAFWQGIKEFNQAEFYACHDTLEALWMEAVEPERSFYQGILQIAVACYHLQHQNLRGATILLGEGIRRLHHYGEEYAGIALAEFLASSGQLLELLQNTTPEEVATVIKAEHFPKIELTHQ
jgi:predicted metal-dependent hydrolase